MTKELRDKWCAALRSGKYQQGKNWLRTQDDKYCCLGVLLDITGAEWTETTKEMFDRYGQVIKDIFKSGPFGCDVMLSLDDMKEVGLNITTCVDLAKLNDGGKTFCEIATIIERNSLNYPIDLEGDDSEQPGKE